MLSTVNKKVADISQGNSDTFKALRRNSNVFLINLLYEYFAVIKDFLMTAFGQGSGTIVAVSARLALNTNTLLSEFIYDARIYSGKRKASSVCMSVCLSVPPLQPRYSN